MKIGIFDSGLGGLHIAHAIRQELPEYDYIYLGDTLHVPYGRRSHSTIYELTCKAVDYLFREGCALVIIACNTASAMALRKVQQEYLVTNYPERRVLGVIVPTLEYTIEQRHKKIGLLATEASASSGIYEEELVKIDPEINLLSQAAPLLVPMIEHDGDDFLDQALEKYIQPLMQENIDSLILGCTHYCLLKDSIINITNNQVDIIAQDEIIPIKLKDYLERHQDIQRSLTTTSSFKLCVTDRSDSFASAAKQILSNECISLDLVQL